ncbi:MAG: type II toxin-antitoxin system prevent-host-death family antitoxin [Deltaproteobacteria bacterium]|nr:type II toxin-antitoxin system prevent-host-death family antitoxin [Deltaproteobacteria bacterium]
METTAISKLKASLSEYLSKVKAGEEVLVTERGKPIAKIIPLERDASEISAHLLTLERAGLVNNLSEQDWSISVRANFHRVFGI